MKGVPNRQKMLARARETLQKYVMQQKNVRVGKASIRRDIGKRGYASKSK